VSGLLPSDLDANLQLATFTSRCAPRLRRRRRRSSQLHDDTAGRHLGEVLHRSMHRSHWILQVPTTQIDALKSELTIALKNNTFLGEKIGPLIKIFVLVKEENKEKNGFFMNGFQNCKLTLCSCLTSRRSYINLVQYPKSKDYLKENN
jgi:hypothetical protein